MNLEKLKAEIYENNKARGFYEKPIETGTRLMLIVSELAEALEADRVDNKTRLTQVGRMNLSGQEDAVFKSLFENRVKNSFEDEIADVIIRCLDLCAAMDIDIEWHIRQKMRYNSMREHKQGKAY